MEPICAKYTYIKKSESKLTFSTQPNIVSMFVDNLLQIICYMRACGAALYNNLSKYILLLLFYFSILHAYKMCIENHGRSKQSFF